MATHRAAWADLARRALEPSVFNDPGFALPAAMHLASGLGPHFLVAWDPRDHARLIGLCCVPPTLPGLPRSAWLHPQSTAAFPLLDATRAAEAMTALLAATRHPLGPTGLLLHGVPEEGATAQLLAATPSWAVTRMAERSRAVVRTAAPTDAGRGGKEMRRQARRLAERGRVEITSARTPAAVVAALDDFLALESRGWKGRRGTALGQSPRRARFAREMTVALAAEGRCRIDKLELDGTAIAMGLVLRDGPTAYFWKTAFDERFARFSPGAHLADAIGHLQTSEPGVSLTDSCAVPGHAMIDRIWPSRMSVVDVLVGPTPSPSRMLDLGLRAECARRTTRVWVKRQLAAPRPHLPRS